MSDNLEALSPEDTAALIEYARRRYAEERFPLSPELRPVRLAIEKLRVRRCPPAAPVKPREPSMHFAAGEAAVGCAAQV